MGKLLDISSRLNTKKNQQDGLKAVDAENLLDMTERRETMLREDRRQVKRTILTEFISVHVVIPQFGLMKVALYDINKTGVSFDIETGRGSFKAGEEVAMRVYLNHQTYFPFVIKVKHLTEVQDEGTLRHGAEFVAGTINDIALQHFVGFLENVSASLRSDAGDVTVTKIL